MKAFKISYFLLVLLVFSSSLFGQTDNEKNQNYGGIIAQKIDQINETNENYADYELFSKDEDASKSAKYTTSATDVTVLKLNSESLKSIVNESPDFLTVSIPYLDKNIQIELYRYEILTNDFTAIDESGKVINYTPGKYYRGIIKNDPKSIVAISFFDNDVMGVISSNDLANIVLGKSVDKQDYITYSDKNLLSNYQFNCGVEDLEYNQGIIDNISFDSSVQQMPQTDKCVRVYYEIANAPFVQNGNSEINTLNWLSGIQNNIATLYENDGISLVLHHVKIWTKPDPYTGDYLYNLNKFMQVTPNFNGDLGHLINYPSTTSVAYVNSLCSPYNYAYSGINMTYAQIPTYSWTIMAMSHEMGHALGSPHTHNCSWNGNNTAIDGCGPQAGYSEGCSGPIPSEGGTIMSYCHLTSVGINFNNGFGPQPGQLIRNTVNSKACLSGGCTNNFTITVSGSPTAGGTVNGGGTYSYGDIATAKAFPAEGYYLKNWKENGIVVSTDAKYNFVVNSNRNLAAKFAEGYLITLVSQPVNAGTLTGGGGYTQGSTATIKAVAKQGYKFESWNEGSTVLTTNPNYNFTVIGARTLKAKFSKLKYDIIVKASPVAGGTVSGGGNYSYQTNITVKATPNPGYLFKNWKKASTIVSTNKNYSFNVTENQTLTATFVKGYTIKTSSTPAAGGTVSGAGDYETGTTATLKATASTGYIFESWLEGTTVVSTSKNYSFTVTTNRTLKAKFVKKTYNITTSATPLIGGTTTGTGTYTYGKTITVKATANEGYVFESWMQGGVVVATTKNYSFTVTGNRVLKAKFVKNNATTPVSEREQGTRLNNLEFIVYPNPFSEILNIKSEKNQILELRFYDFSGKLIEIQPGNNLNQIRINTAKLLRGEYILQVQTEKGIKTFKVFKK